MVCPFDKTENPIGNKKKNTVLSRLLFPLPPFQSSEYLTVYLWYVDK